MQSLEMTTCMTIMYIKENGLSVGTGLLVGAEVQVKDTNIGPTKSTTNSFNQLVYVMDPLLQFFETNGSSVIFS